VSAPISFPWQNQGREVSKSLLARKRGKKMDARANAQRLSRSAAVACLRVLTAFALALVCSIRCFLEQSQK
jgi:hypothetical protein